MNQHGVPAQLVRWVLWSRRRALGLAAMVLVTAVVVSRLLTSAHSPQTPPPAPATPAGAPMAPSAGDPVQIGALPGGPPAGRPPATVATEFAARWVHHEDPARWTHDLAPWCTPTYGSEVLPTIDPATVPATRVTGPARTVSADAHTATVTVPLDAITLQVSLLNTADTPTDTPTAGPAVPAPRWRVNDLRNLSTDSGGSAR